MLTLCDYMVQLQYFAKNNNFVSSLTCFVNYLLQPDFLAKTLDKALI